LTESQKKEQEWITACKVDAVDKNDEFDPFLVGAYSKPIFTYMMTLEVLVTMYYLVIFNLWFIVNLMFIL